MPELEIDYDLRMVLAEPADGPGPLLLDDRGAPAFYELGPVVGLDDVASVAAQLAQYGLGKPLGLGEAGPRVDEDGGRTIAACSRRTPRVANRLLKRARDFAQINDHGIIDAEIAAQALSMIEVDEIGLEPTDRHLLRTIIEKFGGGPIGVQTMAAAISEEVQTIEDVLEPYLLQIGFLERTPRGRKATRLAYEHMNVPFPQDQQERLV